MDRRQIISIAALAVIAVPAFAAGDIQDGKLTYRGFTVDVSSAPNFAVIENWIKHQIDIVADCGAKPEILTFFRSQEIILKPGAGDGGGHFDANSKGITVDAAVQPRQRPVILHELLHAYHFYRLPKGTKNSDVLGFFGRAVNYHLYPATEIHGGKTGSTYLYHDVEEFFAVTASLYLWGYVDRVPHNRERLKTLQPAYYAWLGRQFGVQK